MDTLSNFFSKIFESLFWSTLLSRFDWVDWFSLAFILLGMAYGARKGLMREIIEILEFCLILYLIYHYKDPLSGFFKSVFTNFTKSSLEPAAFLLSTMAFWFLVAFADRYLQKTVHSKVSSGIKVIGGAMLGTFHFLMIWSLISNILLAIPALSLERIYEPGKSISGETIRGLAPSVYDKLTDPSGSLEKLKA